VRRRRDNLSIDSITTRSVTPTAEEEPDSRIINEQHGVQMERCMAALPKKYRQMAELRFVREMSYEEIAEQVGLPIGTVKTQIFRARERLAKLITDNDK
jgi:RNA polymerase sigma-70 factor (ECF subfamily)